MSFTFGGAAAAAAGRRDSWPPTTLVLSRSNSTKTEPPPHQPRLEDIDKDPLTYFLTPTDETMNVDDEDEDHAMMDFDAGIEDAARPKQIVRSLSPSSLEALRRRHREPSPDFDDDDDISDDYTSEDDDFLDEDEEEEEQYIRFSPSPPGPGFFLQPNHTLYNSGVRSRSPVFYPLYTNNASSSFPPPSAPRHSMAGRRGLYRSFSARPGRHGHLWREPSPDVWSIQEETDAQVRSASFSIETLREGNPVVSQIDRATPTLRKKVRFILPPKEI